MCDFCVNSKIISCPEHRYAAYLVSGRPIRVGQEILISYGAQFWTSPNNPKKPSEGSCLDQVETKFPGFCNKHATAEEEEDADEELYCS